MLSKNVFLEKIRKDLDMSNSIIVSPDIGGVGQARAIAKQLNLDIAIIDKRRDRANECEVMNIIGDVNGKDAIIIDDIIDTGGTLIKSMQALKKSRHEKNICVYNSCSMFWRCL
ncbi:phosphoribosyltransferase family protein [Brachyspira hyodysenteriae]|nr:phosphoribosyltransferase family protein [Brachyspira hyodysenteriae]MDA1468399.1 phosphoribosyltransferase family protein [Brachyspira hyodysenteriae]